MKWWIEGKCTPKENTRKKRGKSGDVNWSEQRARQRLRDDWRGGSIQGDDTERGGDLALAWVCRKTLLIFFSQDCLALVYVRAFCWAIGVRGGWLRRREGRGARKSLQCIVRLNAHRRGRQRENPHFSSTILQQCRDIYNNGSLALAALCYWSWSGKPIHTVNLIVVLSTSSKKACILSASHTVMLSVRALISQLNAMNGNQ